MTAAYLAAHGDAMRAELAAAAEWWRRETSAAVARKGAA